MVQEMKISTLMKKLNRIKIWRNNRVKIKLPRGRKPDNLRSRNQKFSRKMQKNMRKLESYKTNKCRHNLKTNPNPNQNLKNNRYK